MAQVSATHTKAIMRIEETSLTATSDKYLMDDFTVHLLIFVSQTLLADCFLVDVSDRPVP